MLLEGTIQVVLGRVGTEFQEVWAYRAKEKNI